MKQALKLTLAIIVLVAVLAIIGTLMPILDATLGLG